MGDQHRFWLWGGGAIKGTHVTVGIPWRSVCTNTIWKNGIWTRAEEAGGKEVEGVEKTRKGNNKDGLCMVGWGVGQEGKRERKEDLQIQDGTGWMRKSNYEGWPEEYTSSLNTLTCIKPDPPRAVFLAQVATAPAPIVTLSDAFRLI